MDVDPKVPKIMGLNWFERDLEIQKVSKHILQRHSGSDTFRGYLLALGPFKVL